MSQFDQSKSTVLPPSNIEQQKIIDKLAQFVARNGPDFESMTKEKQRDNPSFSFLYGGEFSEYYKHKVGEERQCMRQQQPPSYNSGPGGPLLQPQWGSNRPYYRNQQSWDDGGGGWNSYGPHGNWGPPVPWSKPWPDSGFPPTSNYPQLPPTLPSQMVAAIYSGPPEPPKVTLADITNSEENLAAHQISLSKLETEEIRKGIDEARLQAITDRATQLGVAMDSMNMVIQPLIESCTKENIAKGKNWAVDQMSKSGDLANLMGDYLVLRVAHVDTMFDVRLYIVYLINDLLHHIKRRGSLPHLQMSLNRIAVPIYCLAMELGDEAKQAKLIRVLSIWEKNAYLPEDVLKKMQTPNKIEEFLKAWREEQENLYAEKIAVIKASYQEKLIGLKKQHDDFADYVSKTLKEYEKQTKEAEERANKQPLPSTSNLPSGSALIGEPEVGVREEQISREDSVGVLLSPPPPDLAFSHAPPIPDMQHPYRPSIIQDDPYNTWMSGGIPPHAYPSCHDVNDPYSMGFDGSIPTFIDEPMGHGDWHGNYDAPSRFRRNDRGPLHSFHQQDDWNSYDRQGSGDDGPYRSSVPSRDRRRGEDTINDAYGNRDHYYDTYTHYQQSSYQRRRFPDNDNNHSGDGYQDEDWFHCNDSRRRSTQHRTRSNSPSKPSTVKPIPSSFTPANVSDHISNEDSTTLHNPRVQFWQLPAGLMHSLIPLKQFEFESLSPDRLKLPSPEPPSEQLMLALDAYYAVPTHDRPRNSEGWEKQGLVEFYRAKEEAKERGKTEEVKPTCTDTNLLRIRKISGGSGGNSPALTEEGTDDIPETEAVEMKKEKDQKVKEELQNEVSYDADSLPYRTIRTDLQPGYKGPHLLSYLTAYPSTAIGQAIRTGPAALFVRPPPIPQGLPPSMPVFKPPSADSGIEGTVVPPPPPPDFMNFPPPGMLAMQPPTQMIQRETVSTFRRRFDSRRSRSRSRSRSYSRSKSRSASSRSRSRSRSPSRNSSRDDSRSRSLSPRSRSCSPRSRSPRSPPRRTAGGLSSQRYSGSNSNNNNGSLTTAGYMRQEQAPRRKHRAGRQVAQRRSNAVELSMNNPDNMSSIRGGPPDRGQPWGGGANYDYPCGQMMNQPPFDGPQGHGMRPPGLGHPTNNLYGNFQRRRNDEMDRRDRWFNCSDRGLNFGPGGGGPRFCGNGFNGPPPPMRGGFRGHGAPHCFEYQGPPPFQGRKSGGGSFQGNR